MNLLKPLLDMWTEAMEPVRGGHFEEFNIEGRPTESEFSRRVEKILAQERFESAYATPKESPFTKKVTAIMKSEGLGSYAKGSDNQPS